MFVAIFESRTSFQQAKANISQLISTIIFDITDCVRCYVTLMSAEMLKCPHEFDHIWNYSDLTLFHFFSCIDYLNSNFPVEVPPNATTTDLNFYRRNSLFLWNQPTFPFQLSRKQYTTIE